MIDSIDSAWLLRYTRSEERPPLLDVRSMEAYIGVHVIGSTHFVGVTGLDGLVRRSHELPPPGRRSDYGLIAESEADYSEVIEFLVGRTSKQLRGWSVPAFGVIGTSRLLGLISAASLDTLLLRFSSESRRLWEPSALLAETIASIESGGGQRLPRRAVDVGCGSGRDTIFLAQRGWTVVAVDRFPRDLERVSRFADRCGVRRKVSPWLTRLGQDRVRDAEARPPGAFDLVVVVRFLQRNLLPLLRETVRPGGFLLYEHFVDESRRGSPQVLRPGELRGLIAQPPADWEVRVDRTVRTIRLLRRPTRNAASMKN